MAATLTLKQEAFCLRYIECGNASEAYRLAYSAHGMKAATVNRKAKELLDHGKITARLEELRADALTRHGVTVDLIIQEYRRLAFSNMLDYLRVPEEGDPYVDLRRMTRDQAAAVSELVIDTYVEGGSDDAQVVKRTRFKLHAKERALDSLAKMFGISPETLEVTVKGNLQVGLDELVKKAAERTRPLLSESAPPP